MQGHRCNTVVNAMLRPRGWWACLVCAMAVFAESGFAQTKTIPLSEIEIDGQVTRIHTQGLYVTDRHFLVTGRLESKPKRALLFRFSRQNPSKFEYVELTPPMQDGELLDHPGGFDRDVDGVYWIPVSTSHRRGPTVIYGLTVDPDQPLRKSLAIRTSIRLTDHLGALCCIGNQLLVANWDTKDIYRLRKNGETQWAIERSQFIRDDVDWFLAVQDWKWDTDSDLIVAAGIDKSPKRDKLVSKAVLQWIDPKRKRVVRTERLPALKGVSRPLTNEGMAWKDGQLYLLPEDLNAGSKILRFLKFANAQSDE